MAKSHTKEDEPQKKTSAKTTKEESPDPTEVKKETSQVRGSTAQPKKETGDTTSGISTAEDQQEWTPVRHPNLPSTADTRYFVNKNGNVSSRTPSGKHRPVNPIKRNKIPRCRLLYGEKRSCHIKLEEVMVYTFSTQQYDKDVHYIFYKDGQPTNCAWDNLTICDLPTLQDSEIERLQKLHPGTKYTVVRNLHATLTFEHYLVSDAGSVYSLLTRQYIRPFKNQGCLMITLQCDFDTGQEVNKKVAIDVDSIVICSFRLPVEELKIGHDQKTAEFLNKKPNPLKELPPISEETRWRPVGTLPWNGLSFSNYQVSDMGHVRKIGESKLLTQRHHRGYITVRLNVDDQDPKDDESRAKRMSSLQVPVPRLVANAFVDGYSDTHNAVKHINEDKQDNRAQNLSWVPSVSLLSPRNPLRVVASLVDDPSMQKEFASKRSASIDLSCIGILQVKSGGSIESTVTWDGKQQLALIRVL